MKLELSDKSQLFSCTEIPDVFFTDYMPSMNGNFLKVYLYVLFLAKHNKDVKINDLSKRLAIPYPEVEEALKYLAEQSLLIKLPEGYSVTNIQELELTKLYSPKITSSPEDLEKNYQSQARAQVIENINTLFFQGVMNTTWYNDIDFWFTKYGFEEQVMLALFASCFDKGKFTRGYIQAVAEAWAKAGIKTYNELEAYELKQDKIRLLSKDIGKKLRRTITAFDEEIITKWSEEFKYNSEIIDMALKASTSTSNASLNYFDKILSDWHEKGLNTIEEIETYQQAKKDKSKKIKQIEQKIPEFSYTQSTFDNLESFYDN